MIGIYSLNKLYTPIIFHEIIVIIEDIKGGVINA